MKVNVSRNKRIVDNLELLPDGLFPSSEVGKSHFTFFIKSNQTPRIYRNLESMKIPAIFIFFAGPEDMNKIFIDKYFLGGAQPTNEAKL